MMNCIILFILNSSLIEEDYNKPLLLIATDETGLPRKYICDKLLEHIISHLIHWFAKLQLICQYRIVTILF